MIEKGKGNQYKGKSIGTINFNIDDLVSVNEYEFADAEINEPIRSKHTSN